MRKTAILGCIIGIGFAVLSVLLWPYMEPIPPTVEMKQAIRGIGIVPVKLEVRASDSAAGLSLITVEARQNDDVIQLYEKSFEGQAEYEFKLPIDGQKLGIQEGKVTFVVRVLDASIWSNEGIESVQYLVDYKKPEIEILG